MIATALTFRGASNINDSSKATSVRVLDCQHLASSKFAPSLDVKTLTSPGAYAQSTFNPSATRREFKTPVQVTPWTPRPRRMNNSLQNPAQFLYINKPRGSHKWKHKNSQPHTLSSCLAAARAPLEISVRLQRQARQSKTCTNSQIHQREPAAQRMPENLRDCLLNKCCSRWLHQKLHTAVNLLRPPEGQKKMQRI